MSLSSILSLTRQCHQIEKKVIFHKEQTWTKILAENCQAAKNTMMRSFVSDNKGLISFSLTSLTKSIQFKKVPNIERTKHNFPN